jgi:phage terminase large subunit
MGNKTSFTSETGRAAGKKQLLPEVQAKKQKTQKINKLIKGELYDTIRTLLLANGGNTEDPYYKRFLEKYVKMGLERPTSLAGERVANILLKENAIDALDEMTDKALAKDIDFYQFRLQKRLFKQQKDVFNDFVSKKICVMCSRRAGKTEDNSDIINRTAAIPNSPILYINLTFDNAINQLFDLVVSEAERAELVITKSSKNTGFIQFANGSTVALKGNKDRSEADKLQGGKYRLVIIDEAQSQCNMTYLVETIIEPMLSDFEDSQLILTGTPPRRKGTYFEKVWNNNEWTKYHWTMKENPFIKNVDNKIQEVCAEKGVTPDSAFIKREYLGEIAYDTEAQVFKDYKVYKGAIPQDFIPTHIYTGVDFGFADYNGIVTMAANVEQKRAYVIFERKFNKATVSMIVDAVREGFEDGKRFIIERNPNADLSNCQIFTDTNEKSITYELSQTYGLPAYCAYKYDRALAFETLAEWCRTGRILNIEGGEVANEFEQTLYKRDDLDNITSELDDGFHPDITMALLYASRQFFFDCGEDAGGESGNKKTGEF